MHYLVDSVAGASVSIAEARHLVQEEKNQYGLIDPRLHGSDTLTRRNSTH